MNKHYSRNSIIERKLEQLPSLGADHLWNDMHSILDKKMPQKKERRRFIVWWLVSSKGLFLLSVIFFIAGSSLFYLSKKENSVVTIENLPVSTQSGRLIEDGTAKISTEANENITTASEPNKKTRDNVSIAVQSPGAVDQVINNSFIT